MLLLAASVQRYRLRRFIIQPPTVRRHYISRVASVDPLRVRSHRSTPRGKLPGYTPLSTSHPAFGLTHAAVTPSPPKHLLSTDHPAFGTRRTFSSADCFGGPVAVSGFFLAVDPNVTLGSHDYMNPTAQLTIRDVDGSMARVRYQCYLRGTGGFKAEALLRFQIGWISPRVVFSHVPYVIRLGRGIDVSIPFMFHFTMVSLLDEFGANTGSFLYFSGTPLLGFSAGFSKISGGRLLLNPTKEVDPYAEENNFIGHVHYRQVGFLVFKFLGYLLCLLTFLPASQRLVQYLPDPLHRYSEQSV